MNTDTLVANKACYQFQPPGCDICNCHVSNESDFWVVEDMRLTIPFMLTMFVCQKCAGTADEAINRVFVFYTLDDL